MISFVILKLRYLILVNNLVLMSFEIFKGNANDLVLMLTSRGVFKFYNNSLTLVLTLMSLGIFNVNINHLMLNMHAKVNKSRNI